MIGVNVKVKLNQPFVPLCPFREAAEESGFHVLRVINEPTAAVLAYGG